MTEHDSHLMDMMRLVDMLRRMCEVIRCEDCPLGAHGCELVAMIQGVPNEHG